MHMNGMNTNCQWLMAAKKAKRKQEAAKKSKKNWWISTAWAESCSKSNQKLGKVCIIDFYRLPWCDRWKLYFRPTVLKKKTLNHRRCCLLLFFWGSTTRFESRFIGMDDKKLFMLLLMPFDGVGERAFVSLDRRGLQAECRLATYTFLYKQYPFHLRTISAKFIFHTVN